MKKFIPKKNSAVRAAVVKADPLSAVKLFQGETVRKGTDKIEVSISFDQRTPEPYPKCFGVQQKKVLRKCQSCEWYGSCCRITNSLNDCLTTIADELNSIDGAEIASVASREMPGSTPQGSQNAGDLGDNDDLITSKAKFHVTMSPGPTPACFGNRPSMPPSACPGCWCFPVCKQISVAAIDCMKFIQSEMEKLVNDDRNVKTFWFGMEIVVQDGHEYGRFKIFQNEEAGKNA